MESTGYHGIRASVNPAAFEGAGNRVRLRTVSFMLKPATSVGGRKPSGTTLD